MDDACKRESVTISVPSVLREDLRRHAACEGVDEQEWIVYTLRAATETRERLYAAKAGYPT